MPSAPLRVAASGMCEVEVALLVRRASRRAGSGTPTTAGRRSRRRRAASGRARTATPFGYSMPFVHDARLAALRHAPDLLAGRVGEVEIPFHVDREVVDRRRPRRDLRLAGRVVGDDLRGCASRPRRAGRRGRTSCRWRRSCSRRRRSTLPSSADLVDPVVRRIAEEHLALVVHRRTVGVTVALADELPVFAGHAASGRRPAATCRPGWP